MSLSYIGFLPLFLSLFIDREQAHGKFASDNVINIAFYNIDNLYDSVDDTGYDDTEFTSSGKYKWTPERYKQKLSNMEKVIKQIVAGQSPDILGLCELENARALNDLLNTASLKGHYGFVHYDSPDERGIDVALAYNRSKIRILMSKNYNVKFKSDSNDKTRDILWVRTVTILTNDTLDFIVCHFPSRREGQKESEIKRIEAASIVHDIIYKVCRNNPFVLMGDFNDEPWNKSIRNVIGAADPEKDSSTYIINTMWPLVKEKKGTYLFKNKWNMLDQLIISSELNNNTGIEYINGSTGIMNESWMIQDGKYKGFPLRTFGGSTWLNGFSDHLPIYMKLKIK